MCKFALLINSLKDTILQPVYCYVLASYMTAFKITKQSIVLGMYIGILFYTSIYDERETGTNSTIENTFDDRQTQTVPIY